MLDAISTPVKLTICLQVSAETLNKLSSSQHGKLRVMKFYCQASSKQYSKGKVLMSIVCMLELQNGIR